MARAVLEEDRIHPAIRERIAANGLEVVDEVRAALAANDYVIVGMRQNPFPKKARRLLDAAGIAYCYLEYGSYFSQWRRRLALKLWSGWSTFPMVFVKVVLIGGAEDLERMLKNGELRGR